MRSARFCSFTELETFTLQRTSPPITFSGTSIFCWFYFSSLFLSLLFSFFANSLYSLALWMLIYLWSLAAFPSPSLLCLFLLSTFFSPCITAALLLFLITWLWAPGCFSLPLGNGQFACKWQWPERLDRVEWMVGETSRGGGAREEARWQTDSIERKYVEKGRNGFMLLCICVLKCLWGSKTDKERSSNLCASVLECLCVPN